MVSVYTSSRKKFKIVLIVNILVFQTTTKAKIFIEIFLLMEYTPWKTSYYQLFAAVPENKGGNEAFK